MIFVLLFSNSLNKRLCFIIINKTLLDKPLMSDLESNINVLFFNISTYEKKEIKLILDNIDKDVVIYTT